MVFKSTTLEAIQWNITKVSGIDTIVHDANKSLVPSTKSENSFYTAAGPELIAECKKLHGCRVGEAKKTGAYKLPCNHIIHTVGPIWMGGDHHESESLTNCYKNTLNIARKNGFRTIAFPSISTGTKGYPVELAAKVAVKTVVDYLKKYPNSFDVINWVLPDKKTTQVYKIELDEVKSMLPETQQQQQTLEQIVIKKALPAELALSPYSTSYPLQVFTGAIDNQLEKTYQTAKHIYSSVVKQSPVFATLYSGGKKDIRLVVDASDQMLKAIKNGTIKLMTDRSGNSYAQVMNGNVFGEHIPVKMESYSPGVNALQLANSLQMLAMQQQIESISQQIVQIDKRARSILTGQQNDRIGLYYSGVTQYLESTKISDPILKKQMIAQALRCLSEATYQLMITMQTEIKSLAEKEYAQLKGKSVAEIDEKMNVINQSFAFIHQASILRAGIYCQENEIEAMTTVLNEYSRFIGTTVERNVELLAQMDKNDFGTDNGIWMSRQVFSLDISAFANQIEKQDKIVYIGTEENDNGKNCL